LWRLKLTRNQIAVAVEDFQSVLGDMYMGKINHVHPKGVLVIGSASALNPRQRESFNHFRHGQHSLTVITFDELYNRLRLLCCTDEDPNDQMHEIPLPDEPMPDPTDWDDELGFPDGWPSQALGVSTVRQRDKGTVGLPAVRRVSRFTRRM
jgi:hypothetical protein